MGAAARPGIRGIAPRFGAIAPRPLTPAATGGPSGALAGRATRQAQQARRIAAFAQAGGLAQGSRGRVGRRGYGDGGYDAFGYGGLGYAGFGTGGFGTDGLGAAGLGPDEVFDAGPGAEPMVIAAPPPCLPPRIITVGRGMRHRPRTRVTYGAPFCGF